MKAATDLLAADASSDDLLLGSPIVARLGEIKRRRRRRWRRRRGGGGDDDDDDNGEDESSHVFTSWEEAFAASTPCLASTRLSNATQIPALASWRDLDRLRAHLPTLAVHASARPTVQMSSMVQPYGSLPELAWHRPWHERNVSASQLFGGRDSSAQNLGGGGPDAQQREEWLYFFSNVDHLPSSMRAELGALLPLLSTPFLPSIETNLWAGAPGVSSPLHYDAAHNVYCQLIGRKRFLLIEPSETSALHLYPRLHPSTRQSQVDLRRVPGMTSGRPLHRFHRRFAWYLSGDGTTNRSSGGAARSGAARPPRGAPRVLEVVLKPGDRLYIPPYHWHRASVVGDESAISVAAYSQSTPMRAYDEMKTHPLPKALRQLASLPPELRAEEAWRILPTLRAYLLTLGALPPPYVGATLVRDSSFGCAVLGRCACFFNPDGHEARHGLMADEIASWRSPQMFFASSTTRASSSGRSPSDYEPGEELLIDLLESRYVPLAHDDDVAGGIGLMLEAARERLRAQLAMWPSPPLTPKEFGSLRRHAWSLRTAVTSLPRAGESGSLSPNVWHVEIGSLLEDTASFAVGARDAEAALRWCAGSL